MINELQRDNGFQRDIKSILNISTIDEIYSDSHNTLLTKLNPFQKESFPISSRDVKTCYDAIIDALLTIERGKLNKTVMSGKRHTNNIAALRSMQEQGGRCMSDLDNIVLLYQKRMGQTKAPDHASTQTLGQKSLLKLLSQCFSSEKFTVDSSTLLTRGNDLTQSLQQTALLCASDTVLEMSTPLSLSQQLSYLHNLSLAAEPLGFSKNQYNYYNAFANLA